MAGPALLLAAEHADPQVAAREARRRLGSAGEPEGDEAVVAAVVAEGFEERVARDAVASLAADDDSTPSCASGAERAVSDD